VRSLIILLILATLPALHLDAQNVLTLRDFLQQVELTHPSLRSASFEPDLAEAEIRNSLGRFDPKLDVQYTYKDKDGVDKLNVLNGALELPLDMVFGPKLKATYSRGIGTDVNPQTATSLSGEAGLGISLPLFQGIFTDTRRNQLRKAMLRPDLATAQFRMERNALLRTAALRYWDWAEAVTAVAVADTVYRLVQERATMTARRARSGETSAIDTIEVLQEVARRRGELLRAKRMAEQAAVDVSVFLWTGMGEPRPLTGDPEPLPVRADTTSLATVSVSAAYLQRPEVRRTDMLQQTARLDSGLAREYLRPFVELEGSLLSYDVAKSLAPNYKVGLTISQPLLFRSASAQAEVAEITVRRADLQRAIVERFVAADVANSIIAVRRATERMEAASEEVSLAEQMVVAERRKFDAGESSLLTINLRERFYAEALLRQLSARADWARSLVSLSWSTGTI
jgi:outer membrane protein TolC